MIEMDLLSQALDVWLFSHAWQWKHALMASGYAVAAYMLLAIGFGESEKKRACLLMGSLLALMSVNALLQVSEVLLYLARTLARDTGQYGGRRTIQFEVILFGVTVLLVLLARLRNSLRYLWTDYSVVVLGSMALAGLSLLHAISFHDVDTILYARMMGISVHKWLEVSGLLFTIWGAWRAYRAN